jgi:tol-pal system protein YbgF
MYRVLALMSVLAMTGPAIAQDRAQSLADIRQELTVLNGEIVRLRQELTSTGTASGNVGGTGMSQRIDNIELELQRLTALTEGLQNRINSVVRDGTNRIGDLEFRLCELEEGCDIASLGETTSLGGEDLPTAPTPTPTTGGGAELAVGEEDDFRRAKEAFDAENYEIAVEQFQKFTDTYQGGPLTGVAHYLRGESLTRLGLDTSAARAYLESFSGSPNGDVAPAALLQLGLSLNRLGQGDEACITLGEVTARFPASPASIEAQTARVDIGCS